MIALAIVVLSVGLLVFIHWCLFPNVTVKVVNKTNQALNHVILSFGDAHRRVQKLSPGEEVSWDIGNGQGEGNAVLAIDGAIGMGSNAYISGGLTRGELIFVVRPAGVETIDQTWY